MRRCREAGRDSRDPATRAEGRIDVFGVVCREGDVVTEGGTVEEGVVVVEDLDIFPSPSGAAEEEEPSVTCETLPFTTTPLSSSSSDAPFTPLEIGTSEVLSNLSGNAGRGDSLTLGVSFGGGSGVPAAGPSSLLISFSASASSGKDVGVAFGVETSSRVTSVSCSSGIGWSSGFVEACSWIETACQ